MTTEQPNTRNPHGLCTWQELATCSGCSIEGDLNCRFNWGDLLYFLVLFLPPAIAATVGMIRAGFGWYLLGWVGYMAFFFFVWEVCDTINL